MANWYVSSVKWTAVAPFAASTAYSLGQVIRQLAAPTAGNERVFRCTTAGTTLSFEPGWSLAAGSTTTSGTATFTESTGQAIYNGDGGGTAWAAPHARLGSCLATGWAAAGDTVYVDGGLGGASPHNETQVTTISYTMLGTAALPQHVLCVDNADVPPTTLATTATITTTGSASVTIASGYGYFYGLKFNCGSGAVASAFTVGSASAAYGFELDNVTVNIPATATGARINIGAGISSSIRAQYVRMHFPTFTFANVSQQILFSGGDVEFYGLTLSPTGSVLTVPFAPNSLAQGTVCIRDSDLSASTTLFLASVNSQMQFLLNNCKLNASVVLTSGTPVGLGGFELRLHNCDSSGTTYRLAKTNYAGTLTQATSVYRNGGYSDGTTPLSWQIVSTANAKYAFLFDGEFFVTYNTLTGLRTISVEIASSSALTDRQVWLEVEVMTSAGSPLATVASTRQSILTTGANYATSSATWTGSPASRQVISTTITIALAGWIRARVSVGAPSITVYVDPVITVV